MISRIKWKTTTKSHFELPILREPVCSLSNDCKKSDQYNLRDGSIICAMMWEQNLPQIENVGLSITGCCSQNNPQQKRKATLMLPICEFRIEISTRPSTSLRTALWLTDATESLIAASANPQWDVKERWINVSYTGMQTYRIRIVEIRRFCWWKSNIPDQRPLLFLTCGYDLHDIAKQQTHKANECDKWLKNCSDW